MRGSLAPLVVHCPGSLPRGNSAARMLRAAHHLWECACMAREQPLLCITPGSRPRGDSAARMLRARVCTYPTLYVSSRVLFGVLSVRISE